MPAVSFDRVPVVTQHMVRTKEQILSNQSSRLDSVAKSDEVTEKSSASRYDKNVCDVEGSDQSEYPEESKAVSSNPLHSRIVIDSQAPSAQLQEDLDRVKKGDRKEDEKLKLQQLENERREQDMQHRFATDKQDEEERFQLRRMQQQDQERRKQEQLKALQQMQKERDDLELRKKEEQERRRLQNQKPSDTQKNVDEQCQFPPTVSQVPRNHQNSSQLPNMQQQGPSAARPGLPVSEQRPLHLATGGGAGGIPQNANTSSSKQQQIMRPTALSIELTAPISKMEGTASSFHNHHQQQQPQAIFFDRLVSEEVQEFKSYARIIESQNRRVAELERIHDGLESRLEHSTAQRIELEATLERQEREWATKCSALERECIEWKKMVQNEQTKNERLLDLVYRKDKEIHRMIQRKYDPSQQTQAPPQHGHSPPESQVPTSQVQNSGRHHGILAPLISSSHSVHSNSQPLGRIPSVSSQLQRAATDNVLMNVHKSPHEILEANGSADAVRARNVLNALNVFFEL